MKIQMLKHDHTHSRRKGEIVEASDETALKWIQRGNAVRIPPQIENSEAAYIKGYADGYSEGSAATRKHYQRKVERAIASLQNAGWWRGLMEALL